MRYLKENTATRISVGPFLDVTDAITPEIALTATNEHVTFIVDDAGVPTLVIDAVATIAGANDLVHITSDVAGYYDFELTAAQTNYTGRALLNINYVTDHLPVFHEFQIVSANVYDSLFTDGDVLDVNTTQISGTSQTANDVGGDVNTILLDTGELQTNQGDWATATGFATPTNITAATGITVATMGTDTITAASVAAGAIASDAFAAGAIDAAAIATDAIGAAELAADAVTEINSGMATSAALATVDANVDTMVLGLITGAAVTGTLSTTEATTDLTGYTDDQMIGRTITWTSGIVDGEQTDITDYASTNGHLTYTLMTLAPGNGDTFKIS